jgi:hypothetical protein
VPLVYEPLRTIDVSNSLADIRQALEVFGNTPEHMIKPGFEKNDCLASEMMPVGCKSSYILFLIP